MPDYILGGHSYSQEQVLAAADAKGLTIEEYIDEYYPADVGKTTDSPKIETPAVRFKSGDDSELLNKIKAGDYDYEVGEAPVKKFKHISEKEFTDISSGTFGDGDSWFGFGKGREEIMTERLYAIYNPTHDPNKIQFKQYGTGNNVKVIMPNEEEEEFELPGIGGLFGGEIGQVKNDYTRLTKFIESHKRVEVSSDKVNEIANVLLNRRRSGTGTKAELKKDADFVSQGGTLDEFAPWNDELDDNVARELNLLALKKDGKKYKFEASKRWRNAITITTPSGSKKTVNIGSLIGGDEKEKGKIFNTIMRFIESDPGNYEMTEEYKATASEIEEKANLYLKKYKENPEQAISLLNENTKDALKKKIRKDLKTDWPAWWDQSKMVFQNITRDQQNDLVSQIVGNTIDNAMDIITLDLSHQERKDLAEKEGYDIEEVYNHVDQQTAKRFSGINRQIFDLNLKLYYGNLPETGKNSRKTLTDQVIALKELKAEKEGEEYSFLLDYNTFERSLSSGEQDNIVDLTKEVESRSNDVDAENLTLEVLRERYVNSNLAYNQWSQDRKNVKHKFIVPADKARGFAQATGVSVLVESDKPVLTASGTTRYPNRKYEYVMMTDYEAGRGTNRYWLDITKQNAYQARLQHGVDLRVNREVYDKQYGLNEGIQSQNVQTWYESLGTNFVRGFANKEYELNYGIPDDQFRQAFLDVQTNDLGIEATAAEEEAAKTTFGESTGAALSGLPKMVVDFWIGNKALGALGLTRMIGGLIGSLKKSRYAIKIGGKTKYLTEAQLLKHISKSGKSWKKGLKKPKKVLQEETALSKFERKYKVSGWEKRRGKIGVGKEVNKEAVIRGWLKAMKYGDDVVVPAHILNQGSAVMLNSLLEGVKMEVAMQSPFTKITGLGDPSDTPAVGSSFATGFGFGAASSIIPWNKMFKGLVGEANVGKGLKMKVGDKMWKSRYPGAGGKAVPKEIAYKGMYDYLVAAPWSFYAGAQFGNFTNQIADDMMGNKTWKSWLDENYGDWDHVLKHAATELITGLALKIGHGKKYDFASESKLTNLRRASRKKLREEVYEDVVRGKDGKLYKRTVVNGVEMIEPATSLYRKGKTELDAEKYESIVSETTFRINEIRDTKEFLDPIHGPIKFMQLWKPHLKDMGETENFRFTFDESVDKMNIRLVKPGQKFHKGGTNNTNKEITEGTFNPKNVSIDYLPHELLHYGTFKKLDKSKEGGYSGEDVMFKPDVINGLVTLAKDMEYGDGRMLYQALVESGVLKEGRYKGEVTQTKEWELFSYIAEFYGKEGNQEMIEAKYGYDKLASFTDKTIKKHFNGANTPLNTQKDLVLFFGNYARNIGKESGITGSFKHLEKFVSPTRTKRQQKAREEFESKNGVGETRELKTQDLSKKIEKKKEEIKNNPAFIQFQKDKDGEKYKNDPKTKKLLAELKVMKENLKNVPEDIVWGKETPVEKTINDFARVGSRMMTNAEWNANGKQKALEELAKDGGSFDGVITTGLDFSKGIKGRSRETWLQDVKFGREGVDKGLYGTLERFKPETDLEGKESLSAWVNKQYQFRRGKIYNYYEANPIGESLNKKAGEGQTIGDRLVAPTDSRLKKFEDVNILQEARREGKEAEFQDVVTIEGERRVKHEIPVSKEAFKPWEKTILDNMPSKEKAKEMGYRDITDLAPEFTESMYGVKLTDAQRKNLNDIGGETNLENFQKSVKADYSVSVMEKRTVDGKVETREKINPDGTPATKKIKNSQRIADGLPSGTVKFDKGVSDALVGRSAFPRLGTLGELYHLATPKNYTRAELRELGFETNEKPHKDGYWRAATGPGGRIYIKGKAKGQKLTGKDVEAYVGIKDGKLTKLSADRSLGGKSRRIMSEDGRLITEEVMTESGNLDANIVANFKGGKSRSFWTRTLSNVVDAHTRKVVREEVRSDAFHDEFYRQFEIESKLGAKGDPKRAVINAVKNHFKLVSIREDGKFKIVNEDSKLNEDATLEKIAEEVYKEFKFEFRPQKILEGFIKRAEKSLDLPNTMEGVESNLGLPNIKGPGSLYKYQDIRDGIVYEMQAAERLILKHGVGVYKAHLLAGASSGGGIGKYKTIQDMIDDVTHDLRYTVLRSANAKYAEGKGKSAEEGDITYDGYAMLDAVYRKIATDKGFFKVVDGEKVPDISKLKKYETELEDGTFVPTAERVKQTNVGKKVEVMKDLGFFRKGVKKFDQAKADKLFEYGEKNKEILWDSIEGLREAYENDNVSQRVVRQWVEMHAGNMFGLIKTSASFAVLPNVKMSDLIKEHGTNPENYVLEHITPAQHLKARIYHYILSGDGTMKEAVELTLRDHHTTLIPKKYDTMVNKILQADLGASHLPGMDPLQNRYFEVSHSSDFDLGLRAFAGYRKGKVYDHHPNLSLAEKDIKRKEVGKNIQKLFPKNFRKIAAKNYNSKNLDIAKKIDKALNNGRKKDQKRRGMSTWDFDDTLATTKSGVRARVPNPSGKPKPSRKVVFLAGGAGSGKGNVIKKLNLEKQGFKIVNSDISLEWLKKNHGLPENMNDFTKEQRSTLGKLQHQARGIAKRKMMKYQGNAGGVVVDGTGGSIKAMEKLVNEFKDKGYDVSMLFVETSLETALARNKARAERSLLDKIVEKNHGAVQGNKPGFKRMFRERFMEVKTDKLKQEDAMPTDLVSKMKDFVSGYEKVRLDAEQFAIEGKDILDRGGKFDFTEFDVVTEGKQGPFFQKALERAKKFGTEDQFVLTARPAEAAVPIYEFLKAQGLHIPLKNITGLGNSTGEAKAMWMLEKFSEGYNDMYFADDAMQNVKAVKDVLSQLKVKSKVVQAKTQKKEALEDIKDVNRLDSPDTYSKILHSKDLRLEYEKTIAKRRPDLVKENLISKSVDDMIDFVEKLDVPINKRKKYQRITTKWLATSNIKLSEDGYKVKQAVEIAEKYKEDIFSYRNPNELIEKYAGKIKEKPADPKTVKEFEKGKVTNKKHGVTEHIVAETKEGQEAVRKTIDTHWGENSNPWCIAQKKDGKLTKKAWSQWENYNDGPKSIVFQNGKLLAFKANGQYWDRMDNATDAPVVRVKEGGVTKTVELVPYTTKKGKSKVQEFVMETRTVSKDKKTVTTETNAETLNGWSAGTKIVENRVNGVTAKSTRYNPKGEKEAVVEYDKSGKATTSYLFDSNGRITSVNTYGGHFGEMKVSDVIIEKGDLISLEHVEGGEAYISADISLNAQGFKGVDWRQNWGKPTTEIGWKTSVKNSDIKNFIKIVDGKVRVDLKKVLEMDPEMRGDKRIFDKQKIMEGMQAIEPVKQVLDQLDIKSEVQQARSLNTRDLSSSINDIMESTFGIESKKRFSTPEGKMRGRDKKRRRFFIPDSAGDLELLIEPIYGKGKEGIENKKWFEENFYKPWERGVNDLHTARQTILNDYMSLRKQSKDVVKSLDKPAGETNFTNDMAARVYIWNKAGFEIPGLTKTAKTKLLEHVTSNPELQAYAENVAVLTKIETGLKKPKETWWAETLATEVSEVGKTVGREKYIGDWLEKRKEIFSEENLAKMESELGPKWRDAIDNMLYRMETGTTKPKNLGRIGNGIMNYLNGSVGAIMNLNTRSATLQLISTVNFINHAENNPLRAAQAFANQPQYWKDFMKIMNSDMLKQRRNGLQINVTEAELAAAVDGKGSKAKRALAYILKQGYIPTKIADSFAISTGGATYYRNRIRMYEKQGLKTKEAERKAWLDFQAIAEKTQQSSRPDLLSQQQVSFEGRLLLPFSNTPMQMNRIMMKEMLDLSKGRYKGAFGENSFTSKASKIAYYGFIQSAIFAGLQTGAFALMANSDDDEQIATKKTRAYNTMADSFLRGLGIGGVVVSGVKNAGMKFYEQNQKGFGADYSEIGEALLNMSPTIGSKFSKMDAAGNTYQYNKKEILEKGLSLDNTHGIEAAATTIEALTNIPIARVIRKTENIQGALDQRNEAWQRFLMGLGWSDWDIGGIEYQKKKAEKEEEDKPKKSKKQLLREEETRYLIELNNLKNK